MKKILYLLIWILFCGCEPEDKVPSTQVYSSQEEDSIGHIDPEIWILNEGLFHQNNTSLSVFYPETGTVTDHYFETKNGRKLGDTGNDIIRYGQKVYIVMTTSSTVEVLDLQGNEVKQLPMNYDGKPQEPRYMVASDGRVFITSFDGYVNVLDTNSLSITHRIKVGKNPEQLAIHNERLYVANSGGLNAPDYDSTISVIDLVSLTEQQKITVDINMSTMVINDYFLYVNARGNYGDRPGRLYRLDLQSGVQHQYDFSIGDLSLAGDSLFFTYTDNTKSSVGIINASSGAVISKRFFTTENLQTPYSLNADKRSQYIVVTDAKSYTVSGEARIYNIDGTHVYTVPTGINPGRILFNYK
jgi:hypothetical protein